MVAIGSVRGENGGVRGIAASAVLALALLGGAAGVVRASDERTGHAIAAEERVDINRASVAELMKVPGMTQTWAGRIVRFRPYRAKSDLLDRGVLPSAVYDRIKDFVVAHREKK